MSEIIFPSRHIWTPDKSKWSIVQLSDMEILKRLLEGKIDINTLHWRDFEMLIACLLSLEGYEAWIGPGQKDGGVDVIAFKDIKAIGRIMTIWQTKKLEKRNKVDIDVISLLAEASSRFGANKGIIVTTTSFTRNAHQRLKEYNYFLGGYEGKDVTNWITDILNMDKVKQLKKLVNIDTKGIPSEETLIGAGVPKQYIQDTLFLVTPTTQPSSSWSFHSEVFFVCGRPRSGKSTAIKRITELARKWDYSIAYINEKDILLEMFQQSIMDETHWKFRQDKYGEIEILDFSLLGVALRLLEAHIESRKAKQRFVGEIILVELVARDNYFHAFTHLTPYFLRHVYSLFIDANLDICSKRIHNRQPNNFFIRDNYLYDLAFNEVWKDLGFKDFSVIQNNESLNEFLHQVDEFALSKFITLYTIA